MNIDESLGAVISMKAMNHYLIVSERNMDTQVQLIDTKTKTGYLFGLTGDGPGRILQSADIIPIDDKHIGIYDIQKRTLFDFHTDSVLKLNRRCQPEVLIKEILSFPMSVGHLNS
ncbi:MAG: hypothetical protein LBT83_03660 [Tannerella sp.]|nr:hypothetical protein [Tannerella sp.]